MTPLDRFIRSLRERQAMPHISRGARLLDVGCGDGHFLARLGPQIHDSVGIDPDAPSEAPTNGSGSALSTSSRYRLVRGRFPYDLDAIGQFDVVAMLAVFEHFSDVDRPRVVDACRRLLRPGGRVVMTVPAAAVDGIVHLLIALRLAEGMDIGSHHGYDPEETPGLFSGFRLARRERFEFGLNHLFVLERTGT